MRIARSSRRAAAATVAVAGLLTAASVAATGGARHVAAVAYLPGITCANSTSCVAVGGNAVIPVRAGRPGRLRTVTDRIFLEAVSCLDATTCIAVGQATGGYPPADSGPTAGKPPPVAPPEGVIVRLTDGVPQSPRVIPGTTGLDGVACASATSCVAVGGFDRTLKSLSEYHPDVSHDRGVVVPVTAGSPGEPIDLRATSALGSVACAEAHCLAVGDAGHNLGSGVIVLLSGETVGSERIGGAALSGVACPNSRNCIAVGGNNDGFIEPVDNGIPGRQRRTSSGPLVGVSCVNTNLCYAVGGTTGRNGGQIVPVLDGHLRAARNVADTTFLAGVSCLPTGHCVASGGDARGRGHENGAIFQF